MNQPSGKKRLVLRCKIPSTESLKVVLKQKEKKIRLSQKTTQYLTTDFMQHSGISHTMQIQSSSLLNRCRWQ